MQQIQTFQPLLSNGIFVERKFIFLWEYVNGLVQDYSNSSALALELLQSFTEPLICPLTKLKGMASV